MSTETRVRYLLGAATRVEGEGDDRTARLLRRMAAEVAVATPSHEPWTRARDVWRSGPTGE